jgi:hypothetical protein
MKSEVRRQPHHPTKRRWTAAEIARLGREPDVQIARDLGIGVATVAAERRQRGIRSWLRRFEWTPEALGLLGMQTDQRVAEMLGVSRTLVAKKRRELDISALFERKASGRPRPSPFWTPGRDALLGTASDAVIGRRFGVSPGRVCRRRRDLGIPPAHVVPRWDWSGIDPLLGTEFDGAIAERFGMHERSVRERRLKLKIPAYRPERLTIRRDAGLRRLLARPIAEIPGLPSSTVAELRRELGIRPPPPPRRWTPEALRRLGREDDEALARELGTSVAAVRRKRLSVERGRRAAAGGSRGRKRPGRAPRRPRR